MNRWLYKNKKTGDFWEAYQIFDESGENTIAYPRWLLDLFLDGRIEARGNFLSYRWYFDREIKINDGDWVIHDSLARVFVISDERFQHEFEKVKA